MFLKRLELVGFKSFADRVDLEFVPGITAVVGPNGSGKSNISDAIRWVLGEQSIKSLRGGKLEDIIFSGSDGRKAVNFAEVSVTLDNSDQALPVDFHELTVTRRVYRSGDSEFFINKQACRLKDITALFTDTGIGKEAYSIVGQGRIEEIINARSEERRLIFEEAAGIVKYKLRKRDAQQKLDDTEHNLLRIHDLITELQGQIEPLKQQAEQAHHYKQLREKLKQEEISLYVYQIKHVHVAWQQSKQKLCKLEESKQHLSTVVSAHDAQLEKERHQLQQVEAELEQLQVTLLHYSEAYEKCEGQAQVLRERQRNLVANEQRMISTLATTGERMNAKQLEGQNICTKLLALQRERTTVRTLITAEEKRLVGVVGGISSDSEESFKGELLEVMNQMAQQRNDIRYCEQQKTTLHHRWQQMKTQYNKHERAHEQLHAQIIGVKQKCERIKEDITYIQKRYMQDSEQLQQDESLQVETEQAMRQWQQKADAIISRRDTMQELQHDFDGFMIGVREVLKAAQQPSRLQGVHGAVASLIHVPAKVELAIETALGGALQYIVMENEALSREAIIFLKQRQMGRATFLPLDVIRPRSMQDADHRLVEGGKGFVGIAAQLIQTDTKYLHIVNSLLGHVIIAVTLADANRIASQLRYRYRIVTLEGDIVNAGGSMTGGSVNKKNINLLSRQRKLTELEAEIVATNQQLTTLTAKFAELQQRTTNETKRLHELREQMEAKRMGEQQLSQHLVQLQKEEQQLIETMEIEKQQQLEIDEEIDIARIEQGKAETKLSALQLEEERLYQLLETAELARKANESEKEVLQSELTDMKVKQAKLEQEISSLQQQFTHYEQEIQVYGQECQQLKQSVTQVQLDLEAVARDKNKQTEDLQHFHCKKQKISKQLTCKRSERIQYVQQLETAESETKEQRTEIKQLQEAIQQTELHTNRLDVELDSILRKLSEEYDISFELAQQRYTVPQNIADNKEQVQKLKHELAVLGTVNLGAIEQYEQVHMRFQYLNTQKNDLVEAKATLYQVIRQLEAEMSKRFKLTFDAIRKQFRIVFSKLFGGGRADLTLIDLKHMLETGIEIIAQPPGKKLQNMQLLSGGERALTAMALLFAMLQVKPAPFCVLDEVEAALDEANVDRFAKYLRERSAQTQFIIVTHRKGTMEEVDVLYGITMEDNGVSKLVSVKWEDNKTMMA